MITASLVIADTRRLKPKSNQKVQPQLPPAASSSSSTITSSRDTKPLPSIPSQPPPSRPSHCIDPALAIESLLTRSRLSAPSSAVNPCSLLEIGEDEWTGDFVAGDEFLSSLFQEEPITLPSPRSQLYETSSKTNSSSNTASNSRTTTDKSSVDEPPSSSHGLRRPRLTGQAASTLLPPGNSTSPPHGLGISSGNFGSGNSSNTNTKSWSRYGEQQRLTVGSGNMSSPTQAIRDINIAVVGSTGVGKTTFIERAYDLSVSPNHGEVHYLTIIVDRSPCSVGLVEVDLNSINFEKQPMQWPRVTDGQRIPFIDGVLLLYDAADTSSITKLPECLDAFDKALLPVCLVTTKCDIPERPGQAGISIGGYEQIQTSVAAHDSQKKCVAAILTMISRRNEKNPRYLNGRRRANSSAANSRAASPRPSTAGHNRASSEFSSTFLKDGSDTGSIHGTRLQRAPVSTALGHSSGNTSSPLPSNPLSSDTRINSAVGQAPQITLSDSDQAPFLEVVTTSPFSMQQAGGTSSQSSLGDSERRHSYIDTDEDDGALFKDPDDIPILERENGLDELDEEDKPIQNRGWTWDELINRLLSQPMCRNDENFVIIFLCFYRKFAAPRDLLSAIIERFQVIENEEKIRVHRIASQLRYCNILHQWVTSHPGDFATPKTRKQLLIFLDAISKDRSLALLANEMSRVLEGGVEDEDESWGRTDLETGRKFSLQSFLTTSSTTFPESASKTLPSLDNPSTLQVPPLRPSADGRSSETSDCASTMGSAMGLVISRTDPLPPSNSSATKAGSQFDLFMAISIAEVANELTRIDWNEFSRIRPRDLVRHINMPPESRESSPNLACVNNMISHFNHVAYWVASVILEKSKPKHRARALEKFMEIAWTLRHQNNYNSLGAIIAGINGTAVHRLSITRELVRPEVHKNFMRLELLMGTHKSHSKYRLAWDNTTSERIPFLPLHRRDLVSAEEGNRTFLQDGEKINWNKFQVMGDVMMVLIRSQATPYKNLDGNSTVETMIKNAAISMNDDDLYERSVQLESSASATSSKPRRNWFQLKTTSTDQRS